MGELFRAAGFNPIFVDERSFMPIITEVGYRKNEGGYISCDDGSHFTFNDAPEGIFHLGGCYIFFDEKELVLADCVIADITDRNKLTFKDDQIVFQAIQEYRRRGKQDVGKTNP